MIEPLLLIQKQSDSVIQASNYFFYKEIDFWIATIIGLGSLFFSFKAFLEARRAKRAATEAGKTVKIQSITIELTEISQKLDRLRLDIPFDEARDLLTEISRRIRRVISPFQKDPDLCETITALKDTLSNAKNSLNSVRPSDPSKEIEVPHAVYYAIEGDFAAINNAVADLLGLFEKKTINFGDENGNE